MTQLFNRTSWLVRGNNQKIKRNLVRVINTPRIYIPASLRFQDNFNFWITNEEPLRTYSAVHPEYTTRKFVSKLLPSPDLDGRRLLCPQYPGIQGNGDLVLIMSMIDARPVELCVLPLQTVIQDQASSVQDQRVST